jgi:hypothetical protein
MECELNFAFKYTNFPRNEIGIITRKPKKVGIFRINSNRAFDYVNNEKYLSKLGSME